MQKDGRDLDNDFNSLVSNEERIGSEIRELVFSSFLFDLGFVMKENS